MEYRKAVAVLVATEHGPMIINRMDYHSIDGGKSYSGIGATLLGRSICAEDELDQLIGLLQARRMHYGAGVVMLDGGANYGLHSLTLGRAMVGWGQIHAFEPQERIFYMLAGNIALNNLLNVKAYFAALGNRPGTINVPVIDYERFSNFGGLNLKPRIGLVDGDGKPIPESNIGQPVDYTKTMPVACLRIDDFQLPRLDLMKLDVEGMEADVLSGAQQTLRRCRPIIFAEQFICGAVAIKAVLPQEYDMHDLCGYTLCIHKSDKVRQHLNFTGQDLPGGAVPAETIGGLKNEVPAESGG